VGIKGCPRKGREVEKDPRACSARKSKEGGEEDRDIEGPNTRTKTRGGEKGKDPCGSVDC